MERKAVSGIMLTMLLILGVTLNMSMMTILPAHAIPNIYMTPSVNPPTPAPYVGFKWNITLWITGYGTPPVFAWQVRLNYNPTAGINVTRAWNEVGDPTYIFAGMPSVNPAPAFYVDAVKVGDSLLGGLGVTPGPDPAKLAIIEFQIVEAPAKLETLYTDLNITNEGTFLLDDGLIDVPILKTSGSYSWAWSPPAIKPNVAVRRADVQPWPLEFGSSPPPTSGVFDVNVMIENLDADWGLIEANMTIEYNATVIDIIGGVANVTLAAGWNPTKLVINYNADPTLDSITINVKSTETKGEAPPQDELVATIRFTVVYSGPWGIDVISPLDFIENTLVDDPGPALIPQNPPVNGKVVIRGMTIEVRLPPYTPAANQYITNKLETFNVEMWLNDVTPDKRLIGAQFRLKYNATLLKVLNVTEGPFLSSFPNRATPPYTLFTWYNESDGLYGPNILVGIVLFPNETWQYHNFPSGSGALVTITFQGIYRGFYRGKNNCTLELTDVLLLNDKYDPIVTSPINGYYEILSYRPPVAAFTYTPSVLNVTVTVVFNASGSYDFDLGYIVSYTWNFGDDNMTTLTQPIVEYVYMAPGIYNVTLTVTDDDGQTNSTTKSINVAKLTSTLSIAVAPSTIIFSQNTIINGTISPTHAAVDVTIHYRLIGETEWQTLTMATTDAEGKYSYTWTPTEVGTYELIASWLGDEITDPAQSNIAMLTVKNLRDVAIVNISLSTTTIYPGWPVKINVTAKNEGMVNETFDVLVHYNDTNLIASETVTDLAPNGEITLTFFWNTTNTIECNNYKISAEATPVADEIDTADNTFVYGYVKVKLLGDINGDGKVDIRDIAIVALAFGTYLGHPRWNPEADLNGDNKVDIKDIAIVAINFGKACP